jgi:hypothetical protein
MESTGIPSSGQRNAMKPPSKTGMKGAGQPLKKSRGGRTNHRQGATKRAFISCRWQSRTWAPRGQTPVLRVPLTRDHLSAMSGITPDGRLDLASAFGFLRCSASGRRISRVLLRKVSGKLLLIWDGSPIHRGQAVKDFRQQRSREALAPGTTAWLYPRLEP